MESLSCTMPGHPHAGGEIIGTVNPSSLSCGPSPRGWGNPSPSSKKSAAPRAIPTRVGKSPHEAHPPPLPPGHPHAGGEIYMCVPSDDASAGPSPRGWGNLHVATFVVGGERAIPTRVGKSEFPTAPRPRRAGHPHAGGEISHQSSTYEWESEKYLVFWGVGNRQKGQLDSSIHDSAMR